MTRPPKLATRLMAGLFAVALLAAACNNKKEGEKKDPPADTPIVKPMPPDTPMNKTDTINNRPTAPGD